MKSIKTKILRSFLSVSLVSLILTGVFSGIILFTALSYQALRDASNLASARAQIISVQLGQVADDLELIADYIDYVYTNPEEFPRIPFAPASECPDGELVMQWGLEPGIDLEDVMDELYLHGNLQSVYDAVMKTNPTIYSIYISTETGINSGYDKYSGLKPDVFEIRSAPWYEVARDSGAMRITEIYQDVFGRGLTISMSMPCYRNGNEFVGVVGLDILAEDMNNMILQTVVGESGHALLVKDGEKVVSAPGLSEENEEDMPLFLGDNYAGIQSDMRAMPIGTARSAVDGTDSYILWAPVDAAGWNLVFVLPVSDILAPVLVSSLILAALFAVIIAAVIYVTTKVSRKITNPISRLNDEVRQIGSGNFDYKSHIKTNDEIEELSVSFENMTVQIKEYIRNLAAVTAERERIGAELDVATKIQASMLPSIFPPFPDRNEFDIFASMQPAKEVGGDFYDFFLCDENTLAVVMADVSGKGVPAALFMVIAKTLIKNNAQLGKSPQDVFETVNNILCENNDTGMFVTAFMGYVDLKSGRLTYVNAGHNPPLIKRAGGEYEFLKVIPSFILAGMENIAYKETEITLAPGDMLFLYTDGVTEAMNHEHELFGDPRLVETLNGHTSATVHELLAIVKGEIDSFADGAEQADDVTMLALRYIGG